MPNYVNSTLSLEGNVEDIKKFREKFDDGKLDADKVIPYPRDLKLLDMKANEKKLTNNEEKELILIALEGKYDLKKDGFNQGGYDWKVDNWGTKWNFYDCEIEEDEGDYLMYRFQTAWSPITPVIIEMSKQFPKLTLNYFCDEEGGEFRFEETYENGIKTDYDDRTHECEEERIQMEEDMELDAERDRQIEAKMEKENNG